MKKSIMASLLLAATLFQVIWRLRKNMSTMNSISSAPRFSASCRWGRKTSFFSATARPTVANGTNCSG